MPAVFFLGSSGISLHFLPVTMISKPAVFFSSIRIISDGPLMENPRQSKPQETFATEAVAFTLIDLLIMYILFFHQKFCH